MQRFIWVLVSAVCAVADDSSTNGTGKPPSVPEPVAECPFPAGWLGADLGTNSCSAQLCKDNLDCNVTGAVGLCCDTSCTGRNCFHNTTESETSERTAAQCPSQWQGRRCWQNMCYRDPQCMQRGRRGYCCRTRCGRRNCYFPRRGIPLVEEDLPSRGKRSSHNCPSNWQGSKCNQNMCSTSNQCNKGASCCPTKCGKKNCHMPQMGKRSADEREERASRVYL